MGDSLVHLSCSQHQAGVQADDLTAVMGWYLDETGQKEGEISVSFFSSTTATPSPVPRVVLHFRTPSPMTWLWLVVFQVNAWFLFVES